jgi:hypothetical protein
MPAKRLLTWVLAGVCLAEGCAGLLPIPRLYHPENSREELLWAKARRDVFPEDVRRRIEAYRGELLVWPGIITLVHQDAGNQGPSSTLIIAHHYWDWVEQPGGRQERVWLSPRGEGFFQCARPLTESAARADVRDELAVVYGYPERVLDNDIVHMRCVDLRRFHRSAYATDVLEYGRKYVATQDPSDMKVLRSP